MTEELILNAYFTMFIVFVIFDIAISVICNITKIFKVSLKDRAFHFFRRF